MKSCKRIVSFVASFAIFAGAFLSLPILMGADKKPENPNYNKTRYSYTPPEQTKNAFDGKYLPVTNADLSSATFSAGYQSSVTGWTPTINATTTIGGAVDLNKFATFKTNIKSGLTYFDNAPRSNSANARAFVLGNNYHANTTSRATLQSEQVEFENNGFYIASVDFYAVSGFGTFALAPDTVEEFKIDDDFVPSVTLPQVEWRDASGSVVNKSEWQTAQIFVTTELLTKQKFALSLGLGNAMERSRGVIYFQNPKILQTTEAIYNKEFATAKAANETLVTEIDLREQEMNIKASGRSITDLGTEETYEFEENVLTEFGTGGFGVGTYTDAAFHVTQAADLLNFENRTFVHGRKGVMAPDETVGIMVANNAKASMKLTGGFLARRHQVYMINFYALGNGTANLRAVDATYPKPWEMATTNIKTADLFDSGYKPVSFEGRASMNNWALNTFYIVGGTYADTLVDIELWLGNADEGTTGYLMFDGFNISRVGQKYYSKHGIVEQDINLPVAGVTTPVQNASFDNGRPRAVEFPYPLNPLNWEIENTEKNDAVLSGIVNTESSHWAHYAGENYGNLSKPGAIGDRSENNNVMLLQNVGTTWQSMSAAPIALTLGASNTIYFDMIRQYNQSRGLKFWVTATINEREIARLDLSYTAGGDKNIVTPWERHYITIKESNISNREVVLKFNMGDETKLCPAAAVFIDNISRSDKPVNANGVGVNVDLTDTRAFFNSNTGVNAKLDGGILRLKTNDVSRATKITGYLGETIESGNFYAYHVKTYIARGTEYDIRPDIITETTNINEHTIDRDTSEQPFGIKMSMDTFEGGFENLTYDEIQIMDGYDSVTGYVDLVFYIRPDNGGNASLCVEFGNEFYAYDATVYIESITLEKIEESQFLAAQRKADATNADATRFRSNATFITQSWQPPAEGESGSDSSAKSPFQWYVIVPSLIMGTALIVAIAGFLIRRFRFRLHIDKHHTSYASDDRSARMK
jgi:hypothetical protein